VRTNILQEDVQRDVGDDFGDRPVIETVLANLAECGIGDVTLLCDQSRRELEQSVVGRTDGLAAASCPLNCRYADNAAGEWPIARIMLGTVPSFA